VLSSNLRVVVDEGISKDYAGTPLLCGRCGGDIQISFSPSKELEVYWNVVSMETAQGGDHDEKGDVV